MNSLDSNPIPTEMGTGQEDTTEYYRQMYHSLFQDVSNVIEALQEAQQKTEELYISGGKALSQNPNETPDAQ